MTLSDKLQLLRKTNAMTQDVLAEKLGVSRQAIAKWESGMAYPDIMNLIGLSELFHITIDYLVKDNSCEKVILRSEDTDLVHPVRRSAGGVRSLQRHVKIGGARKRPSAGEDGYRPGLR